MPTIPSSKHGLAFWQTIKWMTISLSWKLSISMWDQEYTVYIWTTIALCFNRRCSKTASCFKMDETVICLQVVELCHRRIYKAFPFWNVVPFVNGDIVESKCGWFSGWWFISIEKDEWISKPVWHIKDFIFQISIRFFGGRSWFIVGHFDVFWKYKSD